MSSVRRLICVVSVLCAGGVGAAVAVAPPPASAAHTRYPARLLVYAQEWSLQPSRASLPAGPVVVQLWNRGQDAHDLRVERMSASGAMVGPIQGVKITPPGTVSTARWTLAPGRYMLFCSLPGHMAAGMHVNITVRRG
jgi:uncharacterized cupredoxin-like copper-binding protein